MTDLGDVARETLLNSLALGVQLEPDIDLLRAGPDAGEILDSAEALVVLELLEGDVVAEGHEVSPQFFIEVQEVQFRLLLWAILAAHGVGRLRRGRLGLVRGHGVDQFKHEQVIAEALVAHKLDVAVDLPDCVQVVFDVVSGDTDQPGLVPVDGLGGFFA